MGKASAQPGPRLLAGEAGCRGVAPGGVSGPGNSSTPREPGAFWESPGIGDRAATGDEGLVVARTLCALLETHAGCCHPPGVLVRGMRTETPPGRRQALLSREMQVTYAHTGTGRRSAAITLPPTTEVPLPRQRTAQTLRGHWESPLGKPATIAPGSGG